MSYLKPEEAVLKSCPYRFRTTSTISKYNCLAESCMAWRQQTVYTSPNNTTKQPTGKGYCGLAGKPD